MGSFLDPEISASPSNFNEAPAKRIPVLAIKSRREYFSFI
jgi:hypothetical protein